MDSPVQLQGVQLIHVDVEGDGLGVDFTFGEGELGTGKRAVLANDLAAFGLRYDTTAIRIANVGESGNTYFGRPSNGFWRLTLVDTSGNTIQQFDYDDSWYESTDGRGYSLEIINSDANLEDW